MREPQLRLNPPRSRDVPAPLVPRDGDTPPDANQANTTHFSTVRREVRAGAIRIDITNPEPWAAGDTAILRNQEAKQVKDIGSLIFETPIQHDYEAGVEVRSLLSTERLENIDGRLAVTDEDPHVPGVRCVKFWVDDVPSNLSENRSQAGDPTEDMEMLKKPYDSKSLACQGHFREEGRCGGGRYYHVVCKQLPLIFFVGATPSARGDWHK